jgi:hypothetical protein
MSKFTSGDWWLGRTDEQKARKAQRREKYSQAKQELKEARQRVKDENAILDNLPAGLRKAVEPHITSEDTVLFVLKGSSAQALVALADRVLLVKKGVATGSLIGGKVTTFYYRDITNLEQRRSILTPYLEILTPSYQSVAADSDHWTADNALILKSRQDFDRHADLFQLLRQKITEAKRIRDGKGPSDPPAPPPRRQGHIGASTAEV